MRNRLTGLHSAGLLASSQRSEFGLAMIYHEDTKDAKNVRVFVVNSQP